MENLDVMVLRAIHHWRKHQQQAVMVTVVRTWGSSPRPIGSIMALNQDGSVVGSVSGGCIEDDLIDQYSGGKLAAIPAGKPPSLIKYGITADEAHRFGLPCGGTIELMLEFNPDPDLLGDLIEQLEQGKLVRRSIELDTSKVTLAATNAPAELEIHAGTLTNTFGPEYRMLLIGAGQLTEYLTTMALFNGFAVTVCDPRDEYRRGWSVANVPVLTGMPDDVVNEFKPDARTCIIALTHDPKLDDLALLEALHSPAFYVGAIGSRKNNRARRARLIEHFNETDQSLAKLRGPIGIYIGSKTPSEIAVSVMAEVIAVKNGVTLPRDLDVEQAKENIQA